MASRYLDTHFVSVVLQEKGWTDTLWRREMSFASMLFQIISKLTLEMDQCQRMFAASILGAEGLRTLNI